MAAGGKGTSESEEVLGLLSAGCSQRTKMALSCRWNGRR
jgi:hypothetical protein